MSPHTDDAELGCGALIAEFVKEGKKKLWAAFSTAEESLPADLPEDVLKKEFIMGIAHTRDAQIGSKYAEAFEVIRWIIK